MRELEGRAVLITGAGDGLGRAFALEVASHGAVVLVNDVNGDHAARTVAEVRAAGGVAEADVRAIGSAEAGEAVVAACVQAFGRVDAAITNAGIFHQANMWDEKPETAEAIVRVNLLGVIHTATPAIRRMRAQGRGVILNIASGSMAGNAEMSLYSATKGGVMSLTYAWAQELEGSGVRIHAMSPFAYTAMMKTSTSKAAEGPEHMAPLAGYLLSDRAAHLHGKIVRLKNGSLHIARPPEFDPSLGQSSKWTLATIADALGG